MTEIEHTHTNHCCSIDHNEHHHDDCCSHTHDNHEEHDCGCGCSNHSKGSPKYYKPIANTPKVWQAKKNLQDSDSLIVTDLTSFMDQLKQLHNKLYTSNSLYATIGLIYGSVAVDYEEIEYLFNQYLESPNSKVNQDYLNNALMLYTYIQANYLQPTFYLNDLFAVFDKSDNAITKFKEYEEFTDAFVFAANYGLTQNTFLDSDTKRAVMESLADLNMFARACNELSTNFGLEIKKYQDNPQKIEDYIHLDFDISELGYMEYHESPMLVAQDAIYASQGKFTKISQEEIETINRFDLAPILTLAIAEYDE